MFKVEHEEASKVVGSVMMLIAANEAAGLSGHKICERSAKFLGLTEAEILAGMAVLRGRNTTIKIESEIKPELRDLSLHARLIYDWLELEGPEQSERTREDAVRMARQLGMTVDQLTEGLEEIQRNCAKFPD